MPDYNAGRATGEITITSDTRGAKEAQAAMAETRAEAAALDAQMGKVNETFDKNRQGHVVTAEQIVRHRGQLEELRRTYLRYYDDIQKATERRQQLETRLDEQVKKADERKEKAFRAAHDYMKQAEVDLEKAQRLDERYEAAKAKAEDLRQRASLQIQRAQEAEQRAVERSERAYEKYHTRLQAITLEVQKFNQAHLEATSGLSRFRTEAEKAGASLEKLSDKLSGIAKIMTNIGVYGLFGTGAAGALGIVGGGGLHELIVVAGAALEVMKDFSSALLLMPAVVGAAGLSLGTLAVAFHGVSEAMGSLENPAQFVQSLRELSPAAREAMVIIQSFVYAMRGARMEVQESLFKPLIQDIQPLIYTWLPQLMNAGKLIADQFGQSFHQVFQFLLDPQTINAFQQFTGNLVQGFQAARGAIQPFLEMIRTLSLVGSQVFVRIGQAITHIANEFNNWVQNAASSGRLLQMFNTLLDDFTRLAHIVRDIGIGIFNFFDIGEKKGMGFLQQIEQLAASFRQWTESAKGQASIANFFDLLNKSMEVAKPLR
jgi:hypothetical protein